MGMHALVLMAAVVMAAGGESRLADLPLLEAAYPRVNAS